MPVSNLKIRPNLKNFDYFATLKNHFLDLQGSNEFFLREKSELEEFMPKDPETLLFLLRSMLKTRLAEEKVARIAGREVHGSAFFGTGHEAISCGVAAAMKYEDPPLPTHREIGCDFTRGEEALKRGDIKLPFSYTYIAQYMSKADSLGRGRVENIHYGIPEMSRPPIISHLGTNIPIACGIALMEKHHKSGLVAYTFVGDGATSSADFQGLNQAAARQWPLITVIANNQWAYRTTLEEQTRAIPLVRKAENFGIRGFCVDGTDVLAVYALTKMAREIALSGTPVLQECVTYRLCGHSIYDPREKYDDKEKWAKWSAVEPIGRFEEYLKEKGIVPESEIQKEKDEAAKEIENALEFAQKSPEPEAANLLSGLYACAAAQEWLEKIERRRQP